MPHKEDLSDITLETWESIAQNFTPITPARMMELYEEEEDNRIVIVCYHNGNPRSLTQGAWDISFEKEEHYHKLSWSDSDGDPEIAVELDQPIAGIPDLASGDFVFYVYEG